MTENHRKVSEQLVQGILLDDPDFLREVVERVLQEILEAEMTHHIGAASYERTGHHNGYKRRTLRRHLLHTPVLALPKKREGTRAYAHAAEYVEGISTRKVKEVTEELCEFSSESLVTSLAGSLDAELGAWTKCPLEAEAYPCVFVDARYEKVRVDHNLVSQGVMDVSSVREDGFREILGVEVADTESETTYHELFRSLRRRRLSSVELVVSDDYEGLKSAISRHFQGDSHQRCQVYYTSNLLGMLAAKRHKEFAEGLRGVFAASSRGVALRLAHELALRWRENHPEVAEHIEECLSCLRLISALAVERSEEWVTGRSYLNISELEEYSGGEERQAEGVSPMER